MIAMAKTCTKAILERQLAGEDPGEQLTEITKRLQLLEGEKKANYETSEQEKRSNEALIQKLKSDLRQLKAQKARVGKNERLMREALEGQATGSDLHQRIEPRDILETKSNHLGDLTNKLNKLRARTEKRKKDLTTILGTFKDAVIDNIIYEENRQPEEVHLRQLNNEIDGVSRKLLEAQHINDKYCDVITSLRNEKMTYATRLELLQERIAAACATCQRVEESQEDACCVQQLSQCQLESSQQLSAQLRRERDTVLAGYKHQAEDQRSEYQQLRKVVFLGGGPEDQLPPDLSSTSVVHQRRMSELVDVELAGLYSQSKQMLEILGARSIGDAVKLFEMQADTSRQLSMVWKDTESNIERMRKRKDQVEQRLEHLRYADNLQESRERETCRKLQEQIDKNNARKQMSDQNQEALVRSLAGVRAGLVNMIEMLQEAGISVINVVGKNRLVPPSLNDLFDAVTAAIQFLTVKMENVSLTPMMEEMEEREFNATKSEYQALDGKARGQPPVQPPEKKRFSFLLIDRPDIFDEGPSVLTRAQLKHSARIVVDARTPKIRPPTARDQRKVRRRSTVIDRPLQAMT